METTRLTVTTEEAGQRADSLLARRLEGLTRSAAARLLEEGRVTDRGRPVAKNLRVQPGQVLEVTLPEPEEPEARPQDIPLDVVYEDEDVIVGTVLYTRWLGLLMNFSEATLQSEAILGRFQPHSG